MENRVLENQNFSDDETIVIANVASDSVSLIRGDTKKNINVGHNPHEVAISPNGTIALISNFGDLFGFNPGHTLTTIDLEESKVLKTIQLPKGSRPHGLKILSDSEALVTAQGIQSLFVIDYINGTINQTIPLSPGKGAHMVTVDSRQEHAFVTNTESGTVMKLDLQTQAILKEVKIGREAEGISITPDDKLLLVTNRKDNILAIINADNFEIIKKIKTGYGPVRVNIFDDGKQAIVTNSVSGTAQIINLDDKFEVEKTFNTTLTRSTTNGRFFGKILPVPISVIVRNDQTSAYITNLYAGNITMVDLKKGEIVKTFEAQVEPDGMDITRQVRP